MAVMRPIASAVSDSSRSTSRSTSRNTSRDRLMRDLLYSEHQKELFTLLRKTAHEVINCVDVEAHVVRKQEWKKMLHRLGVCLFSEGIVLLCSAKEAQTTVEIFSNILAHGTPTVENIHYIEGNLASLLGLKRARGRVLDELLEWISHSNRQIAESKIGSDLYRACLPERLDKIKSNSSKVIQGQDGDKYRLQTVIDNLLPSSRTVSSTCYQHMVHCARLAKMCYSDPKIVIQIHLAFKFLTLHYNIPTVVSQWCRTRVEKNVEEDLSTWLVDETYRPETPLATLHRYETCECPATKRARVM